MRLRLNTSARVSRWESWESHPAAQRILALDERLFLRLAVARSPGTTATMRVLTHLADPLGLAILAGLAVALAGGVPGWLGPTVLAGALATLVVNVIKRWLCRPRPDVAIEGFRAVLNNPDAFAFPSGHTAAAFSSALMIAVYAPVAAPATLLLAFGVGLSRVYLGAHYPLDVAAGALIGSLCVLGVSLV